MGSLENTVKYFNQLEIYEAMYQAFLEQFQDTRSCLHDNNFANKIALNPSKVIYFTLFHLHVLSIVNSFVKNIIKVN